LSLLVTVFISSEKVTTPALLLKIALSSEELEAALFTQPTHSEFKQPWRTRSGFGFSGLAGLIAVIVNTRVV